jgi:lytic murein transglycosylase
MPLSLSRRHWLQGSLAAATVFAAPHAYAETKRAPFAKWVAAFRARAHARGISDATYDRVMNGLKPDTRVFALQAHQPEFREETWQYVFRRVSDWRMITGKEKLREHGALLGRIERDYGVDRFLLLALWGIESAYGDPLVQQNHMKPVFPALAALAWGEPRRRAYWEKELLNALVIVQRGWGTPAEMIGSWAGAMGHTQWMPEVWLNIGIDYDGDGRVSPFGKPDDALASSARYLLERGKYQRNEHWGYEVRAGNATGGGARTYDAWKAAGIVRADGKPYPRLQATARLWVPVPGGPAFLIGQNFLAVRSYNPSMNYALAIAHLADRLRGDGHFIKRFPGSEERTPTLAEVMEIQKRLNDYGYDAGEIDGRAGPGTVAAARKYQKKVAMEPSDGYPGLRLLARLREGP